MLFKNRNKNSYTDEELIELYKKSNDKELLGILYKRHTSFCLGICMKYLKNTDDSKDAVIDLFEQLLESLLKHNIQHFKSWLYITAKNYCLGILRKKQMTIAIDEEHEEYFMENQNAMHLIESKELSYQKLDECMNILKIEQKRCVEMFFIQEKSYKEISLSTGYDLVLVKSYIQNGKRNLKICIESK